MKGRIPQHFIQDLVARTDIVELIESRLHLKKAGHNYQACCPFHDEKTPSFSVSPSKQFYYCFGCGAHGNAIGFLMNYDRMEFIDAIEYLAAQLGVEIPRDQTDDTPAKNYDPLYTLLQRACDYYQQQLKQSSQAIEYLKSRGLTGQTAKNYCVGYAPKGWDNLTDHLGKHPELIEQLLQTGMLVTKDFHKPYDRFRNRIIFPIRNVRGKIIGFGGRALGDAKPKYLNSPETDIYHKSQELYGLYEARQNNRELTSIMVVEGYMDVIALHQYGITHAVATLGTAVNRYHVQKLLRYTQQIIFCFDGDHAGRQAAWKALTLSLPLLRDGVHLRFLFLPEGDDPDSLVQRIGQDAFLALADKAQSIETVFFEQLDQQMQHGELNEKAGFAKKAYEYLNNMPSGIYRNLMLEKLANHIALSPEQLNTLKEPAPTPPEVSNDDAPMKSSATEHAIALLLQQPDMLAQVTVPNFLKQARNESLDLLEALLQLCQKYPSLTAGQIMANWPDEQQRTQIAKLASRDFPFEQNDLLEELKSTLEKILQQQRHALSKHLINKAKQSGLNEQEKQQLQALLMDKSEK